jgi:hypothetical protein
MCLATDSIIHYVEKLRNEDFPDIYWKEIELSKPKNEDYDIGEGMNLIFTLPSYNLAYPNVQYESDSLKQKPTLMTVSDSYFWGMFGNGIITRSFSTTHFWYYNKEIFGINGAPVLNVADINLSDEINKHDVIMLMATEANLADFGWGFIDNVYELLKFQANIKK